MTTEKLLAALNNNEILKPYLKEYPFSAFSFCVGGVAVPHKKIKAFLQA